MTVEKSFRIETNVPAILTFSPTWNSMIKTLSIGRIDNLETFFKNGNSCANASFLR